MAYRKTDHDGYLFDPETNVVINTNENELRSYRSHVEAVKRAEHLENKLSSVEEELADIRRLLLARERA